jgi:FtsP/CotA-like multicopper oxidase with cupredoxin domain
MKKRQVEFQQRELWVLRHKTLHVFHTTGDAFAIPLQEPAPEAEKARGPVEVPVAVSVARMVGGKPQGRTPCLEFRVCLG